ncbi:hypothetical protein Maes01_02769 [Microbulbifer aestuariivivens]|uniref:Prepilin-type N-terminal cleavage/methylation domain-containing protein n=1 Tax=Microbulbifer aestuariivivens TaxID=1908308 RepID=A0ABP9WSI1_9GAMM
MSKNSRGFTLIELLITIVIVTILASIAIPSYQQSVTKSRRADGISALLRLQLEQEKFRANCRFYAGALGNANSCGTDAANSTLAFSTTSEAGYYTIAITAAAGNGYTITADPTGAQAGDTTCDPLSYTHPAGTKSPAGCWD